MASESPVSLTCLPSEANTGIRDSKSHDVVNYFAKQEGGHCVSLQHTSSDIKWITLSIMVTLVHKYMDMAALTIFLDMS